MTDCITTASSRTAIGKRLFCLMFPIALATAGSARAATVIGFDDLAGSEVVTTQYAALGVTFSNVLVLQAITGVTSPPNVVYALGSGPPFGGFPKLATPSQAFFDAPVLSVALSGFSVGGNGFRLEAYDGGGVLVDFAEHIGVGFGMDDVEILTVSGTAIREVRWFQPLSVSNEGVFFDDFTFDNGAAVPEPATWAMLVLGFGLAGGMMRRRAGRVRSARANVRFTDLELKLSQRGGLQ